MTCGCGCGRASRRRPRPEAAGAALFTGIVQDIGTVQALETRGGDVRLVIAAPRLDRSRIQVGDSICVQGCCLTATEVQAPTFAADLSRETLALTTLGELVPGAAGDLEPAPRAREPLGGPLLVGPGGRGREVLTPGPHAGPLRL